MPHDHRHVVFLEDVVVRVGVVVGVAAVAPIPRLGTVRDDGDAAAVRSELLLHRGNERRSGHALRDLTVDPLDKVGPPVGAHHQRDRNVPEDVDEVRRRDVRLVHVGNEVSDTVGLHPAYVAHRRHRDRHRHVREEVGLVGDRNECFCLQRRERQQEE